MVCGSGIRKMYLTFILKMNQFDIGVPCIKISKIGLIFEHYIMAHNWDKYDIKVLNDDVIKRN